MTARQTAFNRAAPRWIQKELAALRTQLLELKRMRAERQRSASLLRRRGNETIEVRAFF